MNFFLLAQITATFIFTDGTQLEVKKTTTRSDIPVFAVTASANDGNLPQNTLDHNLETRWSASGDGQWIRYDFGALTLVDRVTVAWYLGDTRRALFEIAVSPDAVTWTTVFTGQSSGQTLEPEIYDFPQTNTRYVRLLGHMNTSSQWNSITEVAPTVMGAPVVVTVRKGGLCGKLPIRLACVASIPIDGAVAVHWAWVAHNFARLGVTTMNPDSVTVMVNHRLGFSSRMTCLPITGCSASIFAVVLWGSTYAYLKPGPLPAEQVEILSGALLQSAGAQPAGSIVWPYTWKQP